MKRAGDRWWKIYHRRFWQSDEVLAMSAATAGIYVFLLGLQAERGSLPADPNLIRVLAAQFSEGDWRAAWAVLEPLFPLESDGKRRNAVQREELEEADEARELDRDRKRGQRGRRGGTPDVPEMSQRDIHGCPTGTNPDVPPQKRGEEKRGEDTPPTPPGADGAVRKARGISDDLADLVALLPAYPAIAGPEIRPDLERWLRFRREIKKPYRGQEGINGVLRQMAEWGPARTVAAIKHTIGKGWQGLAEPETPRPGNRGAPPSEPFRPARLFTADTPL